MQGMLLDSFPAILQLTSTALAPCLFPNENASIVRARSEDGPERRMRPSQLPDWRGVAARQRRSVDNLPFENDGFSLCLAFNHVKDTYGLVGRTGCKTFTIEVELGIVLKGLSM
jgi:hypothetical protein